MILPYSASPGENQVYSPFKVVTVSKDADKKMKISEYRTGFRKEQMTWRNFDAHAARYSIYDSAAGLRYNG